MKKFIAYTAAVLFVGVLTLSVLAFTDDDPKKQKTETASTEQCDQHKETATGTTETKSCCKKSGDEASTGSQKSAECEHHDDKTADEK